MFVTVGVLKGTSFHVKGSIETKNKSVLVRAIEETMRSEK